MPYETLPTAQQAIDEHMQVLDSKVKAYVCSNCASPDKGNVLKLCGKVGVNDAFIACVLTDGSAN
jgi:hypothetical protein